MSRQHRFRWLPEAYDDLRAARDWYEEQSPGLGAEFIAEFWRTIEALDLHPAVQRVVELDNGEQARRWHFDASWPYSIVYLIEGETIVVIAVHHDRRHPMTWRRR